MKANQKICGGNPQGVNMATLGILSMMWAVPPEEQRDLKYGCIFNLVLSCVYARVNLLMSWFFFDDQISNVFQASLGAHLPLR